MKPLTPTIPHVIILLGIPGAGKTQFASHFAKTFQAPYVSTKELRTLGKTTDNAAAYLTAYMLDEVMKTQRTTVFEGPTYNAIFRQNLTKQITRAGYRPLFVWVQTESQEARRRALKKGGDHTPESFDAALKQFDPPTASEKTVVISGKHTFTTQVKMVLKHLAVARPTGEVKPQPRPVTGRSINIR